MDLEDQIKGVVLLGCIVGFAIIVITSVTVFPISYMMNKYIHHAIGIRILVAVLAGMFGIVVFVYSIVMTVVYGSSEYYFGLFPLYIPMAAEQGGGDAGPGPAGTWLTRIYRLILQLSSPLSILTDMFRIENFIEKGSNANIAYQEIIKHVYEGNTELPRFDTRFAQSMKHAGKATTLDAWMGEMRLLEQDPVSQTLYGVTS